MQIIKYKNIALAASLIVALSLYVVTYFGYQGFASSLTFDGGLRLVVQLPENYGSQNIEEAINSQGLPTPQTRLSNPRLNIWDIEFDQDLKEQIEKSLNSKKNDLLMTEMVKRLKTGLDFVINDDDIVSREILSASYGENLFSLAVKILIYTMIGIGAYLTFRFSFAFSLGAIVALFHDLLLTLGFIGALQIKPSIPVVAAVLTLMGYSINDTIVIFDRIRENSGKQKPSTFTINLSIVQTLSRTIVTAILTLLAVLALWMSGEASLQDFSSIMLWGVLIGTYSSIFIAAPITYTYQTYYAKRFI